MKKLLIAATITGLLSTTALAADTKAELFVTDGSGIIVTAESYPMMESAHQYLDKQDKAGGVNKLDHLETLTKTDEQDVVRMNRDTYYSFGVVNVSKGATITLPAVAKGVYLSVQPITEDHGIQRMVYGSQEEQVISLNTHTGDHLFLAVRLDGTLSIEEKNAIQEQIVIEAGSDVPYSFDGAIDKASFDKVETELKMGIVDIMKNDPVNALYGMFTNPADDSFETRDDTKFLVGSALGWGGAQWEDNIYEVSGNYDSSVCYQATIEDPKNQGFMSVTVYNGKGFMFNDHAHESTNTLDYNEDGTVTLSFGCGDDALNNITTTDGNETDQFNIAVRHYIPSQKVYDGYRVVPQVKAVK